MVLGKLSHPFDVMKTRMILSRTKTKDTMTIAGSAFFILMYFTSPINAANGDCMSTGKIDCFECNSWDDPRCHDPFNYTIHKKDMPNTTQCEGCCVKMVQFIGTEHYQVKRTCTDNFEVNFFMVNHNCMTEGHRHGHMCFCEDDECNDANAIYRSNWKVTILSVLLVTFISLFHTVLQR